jgi:hypothetical protein
MKKMKRLFRPQTAYFVQIDYSSELSPSELKSKMLRLKTAVGKE